jgi:exopolyphosphatase/guanosine-5'-triphosphate,3'-diphosphate pyrophosphatase
MRAACIDIGSNTTRLLVAECGRGHLREVHQERVFTRLGGAGAMGGAIAAAKLDEVAAVVTAQLASARGLGVDCVRVVATAAVRCATNADALVAAVRERCDIEVDVLSEREEARLAFVGAARTLGRIPAGELAVLDVGGGSCELAVGMPPDRLRWSTSLPVGSGTLSERHLHTDPPTADELGAARHEVAAALEGVALPRPAEAVAVGGSATTLWLLAGRCLDAASLARALERLVSAPSEIVAQRTGIDAVRVRLLPAGLVILERVAERLGMALEVGRGGLREAVVLEAAAGRGG